MDLTKPVIQFPIPSYLEEINDSVVYREAVHKQKQIANAVNYGANLQKHVAGLNKCIARQKRKIQDLESTLLAVRARESHMRESRDEMRTEYLVARNSMRELQSSTKPE